MKRLSFVIVAALLMGISAFAMADEGTAVTTALDINSAYVWRGMTFNDGVVAQPSLNVAACGLNINVWGNVDLADYDGALESGEMSEVDVTLNYGFALGKVSATVGYIEYLYPTTEEGGYDGSRELYLSLGLPLGAGFSTALDTYYDIDLVEDFYSKLSLSYGYAFNDKTSLTIGAGAGYAGDAYCRDEEAGFFDYSLSLKLGYAVTECVSLSAGLTYVDAIDEEKLVAVEDGGLLDVKTFGGISLAYTF